MTVSIYQVGGNDSKPISTDAKVLINDWQALRESLEKNTSLVKGRSVPDISPSPVGLLSDRQLNDGLYGPWQNFFKLKLSAYATITKIRFMQIITQDDTFKDSENAYPKDVLQKFSVTDLDKMQKLLDDQVHLHYQQWQEQIQRWNLPLITHLTENEIPLSDIEIKEFQDQEPLSELLDRFTDLHIEITKPKIIDFEAYFRLKIHLAVHSSLSRRHQSHEHHEIQKIYKKLKNDFTTINHDEKNLLATQTLETKKIIEPLDKI